MDKATGSVATSKQDLFLEDGVGIRGLYGFD